MHPKIEQLKIGFQEKYGHHLANALAYLKEHHILPRNPVEIAEMFLAETPEYQVDPLKVKSFILDKYVINREIQFQGEERKDRFRGTKMMARLSYRSAMEVATAESVEHMNISSEERLKMVVLFMAVGDHLIAIRNGFPDEFKPDILDKLRILIKAEVSAAKLDPEDKLHDHLDRQSELGMLINGITEYRRRKGIAENSRFREIKPELPR